MPSAPSGTPSQPNPDSILPYARQYASGRCGLDVHHFSECDLGAAAKRWGQGRVAASARAPARPPPHTPPCNRRATATILGAPAADPQSRPIGRLLRYTGGLCTTPKGYTAAATCTQLPSARPNSAPTAPFVSRVRTHRRSRMPLPAAPLGSAPTAALARRGTLRPRARRRSRTPLPAAPLGRTPAAAHARDLARELVDAPLQLAKRLQLAVEDAHLCASVRAWVWALGGE